jgi:hypothetical protein
VGVKDMAINNSAGQKTHRGSIFHVISHFFFFLPPSQPFSGHFIQVQFLFYTRELPLESPAYPEDQLCWNGRIQRNNNWCTMLQMISCDPFPISLIHIFICTFLFPRRKVGIYKSEWTMSGPDRRMRFLIRHFSPNRFFRWSQYGAARNASPFIPPHVRARRKLGRDWPQNLLHTIQCICYLFLSIHRSLWYT